MIKKAPSFATEFLNFDDCTIVLFTSKKTQPKPTKATKKQRN